MKALVTGGGGFLGRHIVSRLRARGDAVRVLGRRDYPDLAAAGVECVRGDVADAAAVAAACAGVDAAFHVASLAGVWGKRENYFNANVAGTKNLLQACAAQGVGRLVYTSTPSVVYGREPICGGDESLPYPEKYLTHYAATKAEAERLVLAADRAGLRTCALRPHLIWGPGDTNLVPRIADRARSGRLARIGRGDNLISVTYVENAAEAHLAACDRLRPGSPVCGQAYFINEKEPVNCWEFIGSILATLGLPPARRAVGARAAYAAGAACEAVYALLGREAEPPLTRFVALQLSTSHWFKIDRAERELGWTPAVTVAEGLRRMAAACSVPAPA